MRNPAAIGELPQGASDSAGRCSVMATLTLVGDFWTLGILRSLLHGSSRFGEIQRELGIATNVLTHRLARLVAADLVDRVPYGQRGGRQQYALTAAGRDLAPAVLALKRWGDRHLRHDHPSTVWRHVGCASAADVQVRCPDCDSDLQLHQLEVVPVSRS